MVAIDTWVLAGLVVNLYQIPNFTITMWDLPPLFKGAVYFRLLQ